MYFVMDGTTRAGFYECPICGQRFLSECTDPETECPNCGSYGGDMELGPDDEMPEENVKAKLLEIIEGEEEVERYDTMLSLAITGGNFDWI